MALHVIGECRGIETNPREFDGRSWIEEAVYVLDGVRMTRVVLGRDFPQSSKPREGERVVLTVAAAGSKRQGSSDVYFTAMAREHDVEGALGFAAAPAAAKAS